MAPKAAANKAKNAAANGENRWTCGKCEERMKGGGREKIRGEFDPKAIYIRRLGRAALVSDLIKQEWRKSMGN
jgi:hypothetical protein